MAFPPITRELLADPAFRAYYYAVPTLGPQLMSYGSCWQTTELAFDDTFSIRRFDSFLDALQHCGARQNSVVDIIIQSRRKLFVRPGIVSLPRGTSWCPRCRRPSTFARVTQHHALRGPNAPRRRCFWCGLGHDIAEEYQ